MPGLRRLLTSGSRAGEGGTFVGLGIDVQGMVELQRALEGLSGPQMGEALQKATLAGAGQFRKAVRAEAPVRSGKLQKAVSARKARGADRGYVVSPRPRAAFYRHMVIKGTKPHRIRFANQKRLHIPKQLGNIRHPGAKSNAFVDRGYARGKAPAEAATIRAIDRYLKKVWGS